MKKLFVVSLLFVMSSLVAADFSSSTTRLLEAKKYLKKNKFQMAFFKLRSFKLDISDAKKTTDLSATTDLVDEVIHQIETGLIDDAVTKKNALKSIQRAIVILKSLNIEDQLTDKDIFELKKTIEVYKYVSIAVTHYDRVQANKFLNFIERVLIKHSSIHLIIPIVADIREIRRVLYDNSISHDRRLSIINNFFPIFEQSVLNVIDADGNGSGSGTPFIF